MKNRNAMRKTHAETGCVNEALIGKGTHTHKHTHTHARAHERTHICTRVCECCCKAAFSLGHCVASWHSKHRARPFVIDVDFITTCLRLQLYDYMFTNTVKLGYNELGYNEQIFKSQMVNLLYKSTRL